MNILETTLDQMAVFPLERLDERALLKRVDTKFLVPRSDLPDIIGALERDYGVLPAGEENIARYRTLYFDSPDRRLYHQHRRGRKDRYKIRIRHYLDRALSMLEIKRKANTGVTSKKRVSHEFSCHQLSEEDLFFLASHTPCRPEEIVPQIWTNFRRITLVGLDIIERLTIDLDLVFAGEQNQNSLAGVSVVEVKQPHFHPRSPAMLALREYGIRPTSMSKYCSGQALLNPDLRQNKFRPILRNARRYAHV